MRPGRIATGLLLVAIGLMALGRVVTDVGAQDARVRTVTVVVTEVGRRGSVPYAFIDRDAILIGRDETNHVRLESLYISRSHAKITCIGGERCLLTDLRSTNGTTLNGREVPYGKNPVLGNGDVIGVADYALEVFIERD